MRSSRDIHRLLEIMAALRDPAGGCPWDLEQTFATIAPFTIEEAYEVADAIERGETDDLRDELGDLLLQVAFHARMAEEAGLFDFGGVVEAITTKWRRSGSKPRGSSEGAADGAAGSIALRGEVSADEPRSRTTTDSAAAAAAGNLESLGTSRTWRGLARFFF